MSESKIILPESAKPEPKEMFSITAKFFDNGMVTVDGFTTSNFDAALAQAVSILHAICRYYIVNAMDATHQNLSNIVVPKMQVPKDVMKKNE